MEEKLSLGHLAALFTVVNWGTTFIATKLLLEAFTPIEILLFRFVLGFLALWAVNITSAVTGIALGLNVLNALIIGILGLPGFLLLLLTQWIL